MRPPAGKPSCAARADCVSTKYFCAAGQCQLDTDAPVFALANDPPARPRPPARWSSSPPPPPTAPTACCRQRAPRPPARASRSAPPPSSAPRRTWPETSGWELRRPRSATPRPGPLAAGRSHHGGGDQRGRRGRDVRGERVRHRRRRGGPARSPASGATFPLGTTLVTCSPVNRAGNGASGSFTVTVQDQTSPSLTLPQAIAAEAAGASGASITFATGAQISSTARWARSAICLRVEDVLNRHDDGDLLGLRRERQSHERHVRRDRPGHHRAEALSAERHHRTGPRRDGRRTSSSSAIPSATDLVDGAVAVALYAPVRDARRSASR